MPEFALKDLEGKTLEQLATLEERHHPLSAEAILIREARDLLKSKQLIKPIKPWHETLVGKITVGVIIGVLVLLIGIFIGRYIITPQPQQSLQPQQPLSLIK